MLELALTAKISVKDKDLGLKKIVAQLKSLGKKEVLVGIQEGSTTESVSNGGRTSIAGTLIADYATENEFGNSKIPERSFMRSAWDENLEIIEHITEVQYAKIVDGKNNVNTSLNLIGRAVEGLIKQKIRQIEFPPNAQRTIAKKGSSKPLIDFGNMINAVRYTVKNVKK